MLSPKKISSACVILLIFCFSYIIKAQNYPNVLNYAFNGTPTHGVKIKTNLPFTPGNQMPTIHLSGYSYGAGQAFDVKIVYYIYSDPSDFNNVAKYHYYAAKASSAGGHTPGIYLSQENGRVVIYLDNKVYYQRFTASAYANGMGEQAAWFQGWSASDEPNSGTHMLEVPYENTFAGKVNFPGLGIWNQYGNVGIGTTVPNEKLSVNGKIRAREIKVEITDWPDYVFEPDYEILGIAALEQYVKKHKHLPDMPNATESQKSGVELGDMVKRLLKNQEELTLHLIEQHKEIERLKSQLKMAGSAKVIK